VPVETNSITIDWGSAGLEGEIGVVETNSCGSGDAVTLDVNVNPLPTSSITGSASVSENSSGNTYSVTELSGYTFAWTISGGTINSGTTTSEISVTWGSAGSGSVAVVATHGSCSLDADEVSLDVTINGEFVSTGTGLWSDGGTWVGGVVPTDQDNVRIASGHTVTLTAISTVQSLVIESGATLDHAGFLLYVYGNYTLNGIETGLGNNDLYFMGYDQVITGTGTINTSNSARYIRFYNGNKTIAADADLTWMVILYIVGDLDVTNYGSVLINSYLYSNNANAAWINAENSYLIAKGANQYAAMNNSKIYASAEGNTVEFARTGTQYIPSAEDGYYNLIIAGSNTKTLYGDITVENDFTLSTTFDGSTFDITLNGDWTSTGTFTANTGNVIFNGTVDQTVSSSLGESFYDLTINKSSGTLTFDNDVTIENDLTMTVGNINVGSKTLTIGTGTSSIGSIAHTSGTVIGKLERWLSATATDYEFPIGTADYNRPISVNFNSLNSGSLIGEFAIIDPESNGLVPLSDGAESVYNSFSEGYWALTPANSLSSSDYDLQITATGMTSFDFETATRLIVRESNVTDWLSNGTHVNADAANKIAKRDNITLLAAEYAIGDVNDCDLPVTSSISGENSVCTNDEDEIYYVTNASGNTYQWTITGGTQTSGTQTNSITIDWLSTGMEGSIEVVETKSGCGSGDAVSQIININPVPTGSITGSATVSANSTNVEYLVTDRSGYTYNWTITGGTVTSGTGTAIVDVNWGSEGSGNVSVTGVHGGCGLSAAAVDTDITINGQFVSIQTGNGLAE